MNEIQIKAVELIVKELSKIAFLEFLQFALLALMFAFLIQKK